MVNTFKIYEDLSSCMDAAAARKITAAMTLMYEDLQNTATKVEMNELRAVVAELVEAQKQMTHEMADLKTSVKELAEAQKRTEVKVEELAEAQKRTDRTMQELAETHKQTERLLYKTIEDHAETRRQLGGLSMTVGYTLENKAYKALPGLLERDEGVTVSERLDRTYVLDSHGKYLKVNILGNAEQKGKRLKIVGESKSQLSKNDVDRFLRRKVKRLTGVFPDMLPVLVTHQISEHDVKEYARQKGVLVYLSSAF